LKFLLFLEKNYCGTGVMMMATFAALVVSLRYYNRHKELRIFTYYILFSFLEDLTEFFAQPGRLDPITSRTIIASSENVFMLFEFIVCNYFILQHLSSARRRMTVKVNALIYFSFLFWVGIRHNQDIYLHTFFIFEDIFLVLPCLLYFYELFVNVRPEPLKNQPSFWVITGILFLNACSFPMLLTLGLLGNYSSAAFCLNFILYGIFFVLLIRAYLCTPVNQSAYAG
jgi:hypothetical protein